VRKERKGKGKKISREAEQSSGTSEVQYSMEKLKLCWQDMHTKPLAVRSQLEMFRPKLSIIFYEDFEW